MPNNTINPALHPGITQTTPFSPAEITDVRRFCGFPAFAAFGYVYGAGGMANLDIQIANMSDQEQAVVRIYLVNLTALEAAIITAGTYMGTDMAAVWKRNRTEHADRRGLFNATRRELCGIIGIAPGAGLPSGSRVIRS